LLVFGDCEGVEREKLKEEVTRSLWERGEGAALDTSRDPLSSSLRRPPNIYFTSQIFADSKAMAVTKVSNSDNVVSASESTTWILGCGTESLVNGIRKGTSRPMPGVSSSGRPVKVTSSASKHKSRLSKSALLNLHISILRLDPAYNPASEQQTYNELKNPSNSRYQAAKRKLRHGPEAVFKAWAGNPQTGFFTASGSTNSNHSNHSMASSPEISEKDSSGGAAPVQFKSSSPLSSRGHTPLLPGTTPTYLPPVPPPQLTSYPAIRPPGRPISTISEAQTSTMDEETLKSEEDHPGESTDLATAVIRTVHDLTATHELSSVFSDLIS